MDEHQQDANSALMELDKGLRAQKVGEQCEAIVRFPNLFSRFPFPILINSAFFKLADTFRTGNNFMRLCILRVAQQSNKHLDKILNVDEFMKRIYMVIHSNDPYARAITLRMLGSVACVISEKKNVHHSIQLGLDSHDRVEQDAAIFATIQFASCSHEFASGICNKIATMLQGLSTPLEIKLQLIPVMQHMHHDSVISAKARSVLEDLLPSYPAQDFVLMTLATLTNLSLHSLLDIPAQVSLLLQNLRCDPREAVKSDSLHNLNILATRAPHLWSTEDINQLCKSFKLDSILVNHKRGIIMVLCTLMKSDSAVAVELNQESSLLQLCRQCCYDIDVIQAALATKLFSMITKHVTRLNDRRQSDFRNEAIESAEMLLLLLVPTSDENTKDRKALQIVLPCLHRLCSSSKESDARLVLAILTLLESEEISVNSNSTKMLLETLASIASISQHSGLLSSSKNHFFQLLDKVISDGTDSINQQKVTTLLCYLLFLSNRDLNHSGFAQKIVEKINNSNFNHWTLYRIARQASRVGEHKVAYEIFSTISHSVASESHYFWLDALADMSLAESIICDCFASNKNHNTQNSEALLQAIHSYHETNTSMAAAVTPNHSLNFQCLYSRLRCETLQAHHQLLKVCSLIRISPPSALSAVPSSGESGSQNAEGKGILITQMKQCAEWFSTVDRRYSNLHLTSFDCDPSTLANLDILQQSCSIMAYIIDVLVLSRSGSLALKNGSLDTVPTNPDDSYHIRSLKKAFSKAMSQVSDVIKTENENSSQPISHKHTECLIKCSSIVLSVPMSFPRYFYQSLQTTNIKLAISPSHRGTNEPVSVEINQLLTLKVEGVIQHENSQSQDDDVTNTHVSHERVGIKKFRSVDKIKLVLKKVKQGQAKVSNEKVGEGTTELEDIVDSHNDYFSTQFLIHFPIAGIYNINIDTIVKDKDGIWWNTGPKETVLVKSYDDAARIQLQAQQSATRGNRI